MYVLSVQALLSMEAMRPHQELLREGALREWEPAMEGRVIFVSHQWLGHEHPDPANEQFSSLKRLLRRLMEGQVGSVESHWLQQIVFRTNRVIEAHQWKASLPFMYVWIDFTSIPQPSCAHHGSSEQGNLWSPSMPNLPVEHKSSVASGSSMIDTSASCPCEVTFSDHRFHTNSNVAESLAKAVNSIPAYMERCCLLLVLVPVCAHSDRPETCNYATWRSRGWCRMELVAALLAQHNIHVMICPGALATPHLLMPADAVLLTAGEGHFTCCSRRHMINGTRIACDKEKVGAIVQTMLAAKVRQLTRLGYTVDARFLSCLRHRFLAGLGNAKDEAEPGSGQEAVARLKQRLAWKDLEDAASASKTGWSLLQHAVMSDDRLAVRELLREGGEAAGVNLAIRRGEPMLSVPDGMNPLLAAMAYASPGICEDLLDARADPHAQTTGATPGLNVLMMGTALGRLENIAFWLQRHKDWDLEHQGKVAGQTALQNSVSIRHHGAPVMRLLLEARANLSHVDDLGNTILHSLTLKDDADVEGLYLLLEYQADVNCQQQPRKKYWRFLVRGAQLSARLGCRRQIIQDMARWEGTTPLANAAVHGNVALVQELLKALADPSLRNHQGRTALECARAAFGGEVPRVLEALLDVSPPVVGEGARTLLKAPVCRGSCFRKR